MAKRTSKTTPHPNQLNLFARMAGIELTEVPQKPERTTTSRLDCRKATRQWLTSSIKQSGKSRELIAEMLSATTGIKISKDNLDMWTKDSHPSDVPAHFIASLTVILGSNFLDWFAQRAGCRIAGTEQLQMARIGQMIAIQHFADEQIKELIADLPLMKQGHH